MKSNKTVFSLLTAAFLAVGAAASAHEECDDDGVPTAHHSAKPAQMVPAPKASSAQVTVKLFQYQPGKTQVKAGTTVTWVNGDEIYHSVTADKNGFAGSLSGKGESFSFTFDRPGLYSYFCDRHEHMRGEIEVN